MLSDEYQCANQCPECGGMQYIVGSRVSFYPRYWVCMNCGHRELELMV